MGPGFQRRHARIENKVSQGSRKKLANNSKHGRTCLGGWGLGILRQDLEQFALILPVMSQQLICVLAWWSGKHLLKISDRSGSTEMGETKVQSIRRVRCIAYLSSYRIMIHSSTFFFDRPCPCQMVPKIGKRVLFVGSTAAGMRLPHPDRCFTCLIDRHAFASEETQRDQSKEGTVDYLPDYLLSKCC